MRVLVLDLEMNQPSGKIIQVGACVMCARSGDLKDKFSVFVNPQEPINPEIIELTGITGAQAVSGTSCKNAYRQLELFAMKHKAFQTPIVWGSGTRGNDASELYKQSETSEPSFMGHRVVDAKALYQSVAMIENLKVRRGLSSAMEAVGLRFEGRPHNALADAINTARIWYKLSRAMELGLAAQAVRGR